MTTQTTAAAENNDILVNLLTKLVRFYKQNTKRVLVVLVILVLAVTLGIVYTNHQKKVTEDSWAAYYMAQTALLQQGQEAGFKQLDQVTEDFKGTPAAAYAQLLKGDMLYSAENFAQAANVYKEVTSSANEMVRTLATLSQAAALQASQDYKTSVEVISAFIEKNPNSFALPQAYLTLALSQELAGNKAEALNAYKYILENYTKTYFGTVAKDKLSELQK